jgi:hypothetical protein
MVAGSYRREDKPLVITESFENAEAERRDTLEHKTLLANILNEE